MKVSDVRSRAGRVFGSRPRWLWAVVASLGLCLPGVGIAAVLGMGADESTYEVGDTIMITVIGDAEGGSDSVIFGNLEYSNPSLVDGVSAVRTQNTLTSFGGAITWTLDMPPCATDGCQVFGQLTFNVAPFPVDQLLIATLEIEATAPGTLTFDWDDSNLRFFGISTSAETTGPVTVTILAPPDHPCCETGSARCTDPSIEAAVCAEDSFCCNTGWDELCVDEVTTIAGQSCNACVDRPTPSASDAAIRSCVCDQDAFCCDAQWDSICVQIVDSLGCGSCADQEFVYINNNASTGNSIGSFAIEPTFRSIPAGFLTPTWSSPYSTGPPGTDSGFTPHTGSIATAWNCVFATNSSGSVTSFLVTPGGRAQYRGLQTSSSSPVPVAASSFPRRVFVGNFYGNDISIFSYDDECTLTPIASAGVAPAASVQDLEVSPDGSRLYATHPFSNAVSVFDVAPDGTSLTHVSGSPFVAGSSPGGMARSAEHLYVCRDSPDAIVGFEIDGASGALNTVAGSPFVTAASGAPVDALVSVDDAHLIVANSALSTLEVFAIGADGALASLGTTGTGSPSQGPGGIAMNEARLVFVANGANDAAPSGSASISVFQMTPSGDLTIVAAPFDTGVDSSPSGLVVVPEPGFEGVIFGVLALAVSARTRTMAARP